MRWSSRSAALLFVASAAAFRIPKLSGGLVRRSPSSSLSLRAESGVPDRERRRFYLSGAALLFASVPQPASSMGQVERDPEFPGTSVSRLRAITERVLSLPQAELDGPWPEVRRRLLWAGGLRDIPSTSHAFNDYNHCDLTPMADDVQEETNANGAVAGISRQNRLGPSIRTASLPELGPGGSWSTCTNGAGQNPPLDVAHVQFRSRVAFKLVWVPPQFSTFVLVDDDGKLLAKGTPAEGSGLPSLQQRQANFDVVHGGRYAVEAEKLAGKS